MKFAFAAALLTAAQATEVESIGYGLNAYNSGATYAVRQAIISAPISYATHYNGYGHHTDSYDSSSDSSDYFSSDFSSSDYGYGYRRLRSGRSKYYRYRPRYNAGRYYYGRNYASARGSYYAGYRSYPYRSYRTVGAGYKW